MNIQFPRTSGRTLSSEQLAAILAADVAGS
jgi:hypothetical protein